MRIPARAASPVPSSNRELGSGTVGGAGVTSNVADESEPPIVKFGPFSSHARANELWYGSGLSRLIIPVNDEGPASPGPVTVPETTKDRSELVALVLFQVTAER